MTAKLEFLKTRGDKIINASGKEVRLRGFCLGSWLNLEAFMVGFPWTEAEFRREISQVLGAEMGDYFFERYLHYFAGQADFDYINSLGCNLVRVAFNYHHFEADERPFDYKEKGFAWLDKVISWARSAGVYISLDFHAYPGWQSRGWHCDNPGGPPQFWDQIHFQDRGVALWEQLASRYKDEPTVAMYGIMNEPEVRDVVMLNRFNERVAQAIRAIDDRHILNFEGNFYSTDFSQLDPPPDPNVVYSSHLYVNVGLNDVEYPGSVGDEYFDREAIERIYQERRAYCAEHNIPHYFSEFGVIYNDPALNESRFRLMADFLEVTESYDDHWTIWSYKDIGKMGMLSVDPESPWMARISPIQRVKTELRADSWVDRSSPGLDTHLDSLSEFLLSRFEKIPGDWGSLSDELGFMIGDRFIARMLLPPFVEQFRGMSEGEIDDMMASFAFENCSRRTELEEIIKKYTLQEQA